MKRQIVKASQVQKNENYTKNTLEVRNLITPSGIVIVDVRLAQPKEEEEIIGWEPDPEEFEGLEEDYDYAADDRNFDAWREIGYR